MMIAAPKGPAERWAEQTSPRQYRKSRHEFDQLVVDAVPAYAAHVASALARFHEATAASLHKYDAAHRYARVLSPTQKRVQLVLQVTVFLAPLLSLGLMYPTGRGAPSPPTPLSWIPAMTAASTLLIVLAVVALVLGATVYKGYVPPRDNVVWFPSVCGVLALFAVAWWQAADVGVAVWTVPVYIAAVAVSLVFVISRLLVRRRDPQLTRKVDDTQKDRGAAFRASTQAHADTAAKQMHSGFTQLPQGERQQLVDEVRRATLILQQRQLMASTPSSVAVMHSKIAPQARLLSGVSAALPGRGGPE